MALNEIPAHADDWLAWFDERLAETQDGYSAAPDWLKGHANGEASAARDYAGRELLELVQNAADAAAEVGGRGRVRIEISDEGLLVANTGMPFRTKGIRSLMTAHTSDKPERQATLIGAKGLGFRALLNWSHEPFITSGALEVAFSRTHATEQVKELARKSEKIAALLAESRIVPAPILCFPAAGAALAALERQAPSILFARARELRAEGYDTVVAAPFDDSKAREQATSQLAEFQPDFLLFVEAIDEIVMRVDTQPEVRWVSISVEHDRFAIEVSGQSHSSFSEWYCMRKRGVLPDPQSEDGGTRPFELAIAIRPELTEESGNLHCYFPTSVQLPFPALFHATLELNSSRKLLNDNSELNDGVLRELAIFYAEVLTELRARRALTDTIAQLTRSDKFPTVLSNFETHVYEAGRRQPLVRTNGGHYVTGERAVLGPKGYGGYLPGRFFRTLARCRHDRDRRTLERLEIDELNPRHMLKTLLNAPLTIDERARAIVGIANSLPRKFHDRRLLLDINLKSLTRNNSCFPLPSSGKAPALPRWATAKFIHPELWKRINSQLLGTQRARFEVLNGFGIHEFNAAGVITSLRRQATDQLVSSRVDPDKVRRELLATLYALRKSVAKDIATPGALFEVMCVDGGWRKASEVHLSESYGDAGRIVSALYASQPDRLLGISVHNGLGDPAEDHCAFFLWLGVNTWPVQETRLVPSSMRDFVVDALPSHFEVAEGNHRREISRDALYWGSTYTAEHDSIVGLDQIVTTAPSAAILAWLALDLRFDVVRPTKFETRLKAKSGGASYKLYHGPLPDLVREALISSAWLATTDGDNAAPRITMVQPGALSVLFKTPAPPTIEQETQFGLTRQLWLRGLINAQLPQSLADLGEAAVYHLLLTLKERGPIADMVRRIYNQILGVEDFAAARAPEDAKAFREQGEVQARQDGAILWSPVGDTLYLDRDNFPSAAREHLTLIDLPARRSATEVEARFGVVAVSKQPFGLTIGRTVEATENVAALLAARFADGLPFIKALRAANSMDSARLRRLEALELTIVVDADLEFSLGTKIFAGQLDPGKYVLKEDQLLVCVDISESEDEIVLRAITAISDGLAELFELQAGDDFEKLLTQHNDVLRMVQLRRLLANQTPEEVDRLIAGLEGEIAQSENGYSVDAATLAAALGPIHEHGTRENDAATDTTSATGNQDSPTDADTPSIAAALTPPASPQSLPPPPSRPLLQQRPKATRVEVTELDLQPGGSGRGGRSVGLRIGGVTSSGTVRRDSAAPRDAEEWTALLEQNQGRYPLDVTRLQGSDAYGCDYLSFSNDANCKAFMADPSLVSLIERFIEVKSGLVRLTLNQQKVARREKSRYFVYQFAFDISGRGNAHVTIVADPLSHRQALARECEVKLEQIPTRQKLRLTAS